MKHLFNALRSKMSRRQILFGAGASLGYALTQPLHAQNLEASAPPRLALLIGNRAYPEPHDLPPVHKNVRDLDDALKLRGFQVSTALDQTASQLKQTIADFAKKVHAAPRNAVVFFYFTGHGMQLDAENLLLGSATDPTAKEPALRTGSLYFKRDLLDSLPHRPEGITMAVLDACRTSVKAAISSSGLNQVEAPTGCMIVFSTGAGRPAIAPAVETQNTFYTASLLKVLRTASDDISFSDMFHLSKADVQETMLNHRLAAIRQMAQFPFIAENLRVQTTLSPKASSQDSSRRFLNNSEETLWATLQNSTWPADVVKAAEAYLSQFPSSPLSGSVTVSLTGAKEAAKVVRRNDIRLFKSAFTFETPHTELKDELKKAGRGDKDAAARLARAHLKQQYGLSADDNRYQGWLQYASALGNGIAAYELALHYRKLEQPILAAQFEARALELGYTPPPSLDHSRK